MSIPTYPRAYGRPPHPGPMLRGRFFPDLGLTVATLADAIGVSRQTVNELLLERRGVSAEMALRLATLFGMSPEFWLNLQREVDLWDARQALQGELKKIRPMQVA